MVKDVTKRLADFGYTVGAADAHAIDFLISKWSDYVLDFCNLKELPEGVEPKLIDKICGEFLYYKKNAGQLGEEFDFDAPAKIIKEGDTSITMSYGEGGKTPEQRFDNMLTSLMQSFDKNLVKYREFVW